MTARNFDFVVPAFRAGDDCGWYESDRPWEGDWRNPAFAVRVVAVGAVWALPGVLAGLMASLPLGPTADPAAAAAVGAVLFAFAGGRWEAAD